AGLSYFLSGPPRLHVQNLLTAGTDGAAVSSSGFNTRVINTTVVNEIGATVSSNEITLAAGVYRARGTFIISDSLSSTGGTIAGRLRNITDGTDIGLFMGAGRVGFMPGIFTIDRNFTLAAEKKIAVQNRTTAGITAIEGRNSSVPTAGDM